jgi:hypothetical protein
LATEAAHHVLEVALACCTCPWSAVPSVAHGSVMAVMTWRTFLGLIQGRGIIDAWAALLTGTGVDHQVRRADQPLLHGGRRLDCQPFRHQWRVQTAANVGEHFWKHNMRLGAIHLHRGDSTGIHHRQLGPQPATDLCT